MGIETAIISIITAIFTSSQAIAFGVKLLNKLIFSLPEEYRELKEQWAKTTRLIDKKTPIKLSDETDEILREIEERDRLEKEKSNRLQEQNDNLFKENVKLKDTLRKNNVEFTGEF